MTIGEMKITDDEFDFGHMFLIDLPLQLFHSSISVQECIVLQVQHKRYSAKGDAGTYPSCQRWFLPVLPTTLAHLLLRSQAEREALRCSYPFDQRRMRGYCCAVRSNERQLPYGSGKTKGEASPQI